MFGQVVPPLSHDERPLRIDRVTVGGWNGSDQGPQTPVVRDGKKVNPCRRKDTSDLCEGPGRIKHVLEDILRNDNVKRRVRKGKGLEIFASYATVRVAKRNVFVRMAGGVSWTPAPESLHCGSCWRCLVDTQLAPLWKH